MTDVSNAVATMLTGDGYACEVGAYDGEFQSNTLAFEMAGWTVLCIEANPRLEKRGREKRKLWRAVACGPQDVESACFYSFADGPGASALHPRADYVEMIGGVPEILQVPVRRLDRLLEEAGFPRLDYLSIDVEGYEKQVLEGFTIEQWKPKVMVIESLKDDLETPAGYERTHRLVFDNVYRRLT